MERTPDAAGRRAPRAARRYSLGLHEMADHYDAVIVGSGYGGGITASRLARAGARVCILERGKELHPGEYPSGAASAPRHIQANTSRGRIGSPTALIDFHMASDLGVVRGCGLGGTSLINANVARRADPRVFDDDRWPAELRGDGAETLKPYYERAEAMLGSKLPPRTLLDLPKTKALARSAAALGAEFKQAPLNVTFTDGLNAAGVMQNACTLCGDCVSGCNHNAKNTILMNYIPDAHRHGAQIFCEVSVRTVQKHTDGRWLVEFADQSFGARRFGSPTRFVTADVVILAAGSLGSTEILLRSRAAGLDVSPRLGHSFTGNGDVLAFAFDADTKLNSVGAGKKAVTQETAVGPCIAGMVDVKGVDGADDFLIQEGSVPGSTGWVSGLVWSLSALLFGDDGTTGLPRLRKRLWQFVRSLFGPSVGPPSRSMTYLVMSIDDDNGQLTLNGDRLDIRWPNIAQRPVFRAINDQLATAGKALGGSFVPSPMWASPVGSTLLTVQPLGGCDMGDDATHGVVNHKGQVFAGQSGTAVHDGLYVADGAVIPRPLGANPSLTISAVAERISDMLIADRGYAAEPARASKGRTEPGVRFSERLTGHFSTKVHQGYGAGEQQGKADRSPLELVLTISYDTLDMLEDGDTTGHISGSVFAPALSPQRLVCAGTFRLFVPDPRFVETWHMRYDLELRTEDGTTYGLRAFKLLRERGSLDAWPDTTTAYATINDASGGVIGVGIVRIGMLDFVRLMTTVEGPGSSGLQGWRIRFGFFRMFVKNVLSMYGGPLDTTGAFPPPSAPELPAPMRVLRVKESERHWLDRAGTWRSGTAEGADAAVQLTRYPGGTKGPVILACGFGMSATSYVLDTTECNLVEFLCERDYDVWLFDHRGGIFMPGREEPFTLDDVAAKDWPAAVAKVIEVTGAPDVQVVAHCAGALTLQMALLRGMTGVRSAVCSALTVFFKPNPLKRFLNGLGLEGMIAKIGIKGFTPPTRPTLLNKIIDVVLRLHPIPHEERCGQAICRWVNGIYGPSWHHPQLNEATHEALWSAFGFGNFSAGRQFGAMFKAGHVLDAGGKDTYLGHPERLAVPLLLVHGAKSYMFNPTGSAKTLTWLRKNNDPSLYERIVLPDYGHVDTFIGRNAHVEVFPSIVEHLDRFGSS